MRLSTLADPGSPPPAEVEIAGLALDSREVRPGDLFAALPGGRNDGAAFAEDALRAGAVALLGGPALAGRAWPVPVLADADPRALLARVAARFFAPQPAIVAAVTGTNGKTSVASFTRQLWRLDGHTAASIGTLGVESSTGDLPGRLTTPDPVTLHRLAGRLAAEGVDHLVIEASSHGLEQKRVDGLRIRAAAFTNLTRDHLDHHGTMDAYLAAKARLFGEVLVAGGTAVLNADVPEFAGLAALCRDRGIEVVDYGRGAGRLRLVAQRPGPAGQELRLALDGDGIEVASRLIGGFQAMNLLAATGLWLATGGRPADLARHLATITGAPGRMEHVGTTRSGGAVYVDFAHTPDALDQALTAARAHAQGRLVVVFGCGGDRDPGKRPLMGAIAARLADLAIVTDDNPRSEDPAAIRAAVMAASPRLQDGGERARAIAMAIDGLREGDVLLIAGKGHESGQTIGTVTLPFDDRAVARACLGSVG